MNVEYLMILNYAIDESADIEKWSLLNTKIDYVEQNRKELPINNVKFNPTEGKCQGYRQFLGGNRTCQEIILIVS